MYGLGDDCQFGTNADGSCIVGPTLPVAGCPQGLVMLAGQCVIPGMAVSPNVDTSGINLNLPTSQGFSQWVQANSTLLVVGFGAFGALLALMNFSKGGR